MKKLFIFLMLCLLTDFALALQKNVAGQKVGVYAHDTLVDAPKTGDAANITAYIWQDWASGAAVADTNPTELDPNNAPGIYVFDITQADSNGDVILLDAVSSTVNVDLDPVIYHTTPATFPDEALATEAKQDVIDTNVDDIENDTSAVDTTSEMRTFLTGADTPVAKDSTPLTQAEIRAAVWNAATASYGDPNTYGAAMEDVLEDTATTIPGLITAGGIGDGSVVVDHDTGGADALAYETAGGAGIDNGVIRAYLKSDYDAGNTGSAFIKASTTTDVNGRWTNQMNLDPATYTLYYFKQGAYSPSTQEVAVE